MFGDEYPGKIRTDVWIAASLTLLAMTAAGKFMGA
jgi:hypothetical protein